MRPLYFVTYGKGRIPVGADMHKFGTFRLFGLVEAEVMARTMWDDNHGREDCYIHRIAGRRHAAPGRVLSCWVWVPDDARTVWRMELKFLGEM